MKKALEIVVLIGVLVAGAAIAAAVFGALDAASAEDEVAVADVEATAEEAEDDAGDAAEIQDEDGSETHLFGFADDFISDVLDELVADGTLTEEQAAAVAEAFAARIEEMLEGLDFESFTAPFRGFRFDFDELPEGIPFLGEDSPLREFLEDGELSEEERRELEERLGDLPFRGFRFFGEDGELPPRFGEFFDEFGELPLQEFLEDGELSEEEREQLREFFGDLPGRRFGFFTPQDQEAFFSI